MLSIKRSAVALAATATLCAITLSGCSSTPEAQLDLPAKNVAQWTMPLDQYMAIDLREQDYAENLLVKPCMEGAGFAWPVPWRDASGSVSETYNDVNRRLFNQDIASRYGYHNAPDADVSASSWRKFVAATSDLSSAEEDQVTKCIFAARKKLPRLSPSAQDGIALGQAATDAARDEPAVAKAEKEWRQCMQPKGISDLPGTPRKMPSESLQIRFNISSSKAATAEEIDLAKFDADCRDKSGYVKTLYNAEWNQQVSSLRKNADQLQRIAGEIRKNRSEVKKVIATNPATS